MLCLAYSCRNDQSAKCQSVFGIHPSLELLLHYSNFSIAKLEEATASRLVVFIVKCILAK